MGRRRRGMHHHRLGRRGHLRAERRITMTTTLTRPFMLSDELIAQCAERAPMYDRENRFFQEDWDAIRATGFLNAPVPTDLGGAGYSLTQTCEELRRLAGRAPATALAVNMHQYWVGIAAEMRRL